MNVIVQTMEAVHHHCEREKKNTQPLQLFSSVIAADWNISQLGLNLDPSADVMMSGLPHLHPLKKKNGRNLIHQCCSSSTYFAFLLCFFVVYFNEG